MGGACGVIINLVCVYFEKTILLLLIQIQIQIQLHTHTLVEQHDTCSSAELAEVLLVQHIFKWLHLLRSALPCLASG